MTFVQSFQGYISWEAISFEEVMLKSCKQIHLSVCSFVEMMKVITVDNKLKYAFVCGVCVYMCGVSMYVCIRAACVCGVCVWCIILCMM